MPETKKRVGGRIARTNVIKGSRSGWVVKEFNPDTLVGIVMYGSDTRSFDSTSFQARTGFRFPRKGESVEVAMTTAGALLSVHGK